MKSNETAEAILIVLKTIGKWILIAVAILFALFSIFFTYVKIDDYIESKPKVVDEFFKIKLDEKLNDVLFRIEGLKLHEEDLRTGNNLVTRYSNKDSGITINVESGRVSSILYDCKDNSDYMVVNNIFCNDLGEKVLEKYNDIRILCYKDRVDLRVYNAVNYGVGYILFSNRIAGFYVSKPSDIEKHMGDYWQQCE